MYQVGKGRFFLCIKKRLEKKIFENKTVKKLYDIRGGNYICKAFLYGYIVVSKKIQKTWCKKVVIAMDTCTVMFKKLELLSRNTGSLRIFWR